MSDFDGVRACVGVALGAWLLAIAFVLPGVIDPGNTYAVGSYAVGGTALAGLSAYSLWSTRRDLPGDWAAAFAIAVVGAWLITVPFATTETTSGWLGWNALVVGVLSVWIGFNNGYAALDWKLDLSPPKPDRLD